MDHGIYYRTDQDYGKYAPRRLPKGGPAAPSLGPTSPTDPNANPLVVQRSYSEASVAPHADVERWEYTVPPRRRALLQSALATVLRDIAAVTPGGSKGTVLLRRAGNTVQVALSHAMVKNGAVDARSFMVHPGPVELFAGDTLRATTGDTSADGLITYTVQATLIEYDEIYSVIGSDSAGTLGGDNPGAGSGSHSWCQPGFTNLGLRCVPTAIRNSPGGPAPRTAFPRFR